jgi:hypothetical protein
MNFFFLNYKLPSFQETPKGVRFDFYIMPIPKLAILTQYLFLPVFIPFWLEIRDLEI